MISKFLIFLIMISAYWPQHAWANETQGSGKSSNTGSRTEAVNPGIELKREACPTTLKNWIQDDYTDKQFGLYKSESQTCNIAVSAYKKFLSNNGKSAQINSSTELSNDLSAKFSKQISPAYKNLLQGCHSLPPEQEKLIQARFYSAASRLEAVNSTTIDEISYIDSIVPGNSILSDLECTHAFPELKQKCDDYKRVGGQCQQDQNKRFQDLVDKTMKNLEEIERLKAAERNCINTLQSSSTARRTGRGFDQGTNNAIKQKCLPIGAAIQILENQTPWVRGDIFKNMAVDQKADPRRFKFTTTYKGRDQIAVALKSQLQANRSALADNYKNNLQDFQCLTYNTKTNGDPCDFEKIRTNIAKIPNLVLPTNNNTQKDQEVKTYLEADSCLLERGEDRAQTKATTNNAATTAALTLATMGASNIVAGVRVFGTVSKGARLRQAAIAGMGAGNVTYAAAGISQAYKSCSAEHQKVSAQITKSEITKNNVCNNPMSSSTQAQEAEDDCLIDSLLASTDVLPFVGTASSLMKLGKIMSKEDLIKHLKNPLDRAELEKILARNGNLNPEERIQAAEKLLGRKMNPAENKCIMDAHNIGQGHSYGTYTAQELLQKKTMLKGCGFNLADTTLLMRTGVTGNNPVVAGSAPQAFRAQPKEVPATSLAYDNHRNAESADDFLFEQEKKALQRQRMDDAERNRLDSQAVQIAKSQKISVADARQTPEYKKLEDDYFNKKAAREKSALASTDERKIATAKVQLAEASQNTKALDQALQNRLKLAEGDYIQASSRQTAEGLAQLSAKDSAKRAELILDNSGGRSINSNEAGELLFRMERANVIHNDRVVTDPGVADNLAKSVLDANKSNLANIDLTRLVRVPRSQAPAGSVAAKLDAEAAIQTEKTVLLNMEERLLRQYRHDPKQKDLLDRIERRLESFDD